jgi:hypothetical protein
LLLLVPTGLSLAGYWRTAAPGSATATLGWARTPDFLSALHALIRCYVTTPLIEPKRPVPACQGSSRSLCTHPRLNCSLADLSDSKSIARLKSQGFCACAYSGILSIACHPSCDPVKVPTHMGPSCCTSRRASQAPESSPAYSHTMSITLPAVCPEAAGA